MKAKRAFALILMAAMLLSVAASCRQGQEDPTTATTTAATDTAADATGEAVDGATDAPAGDEPATEATTAQGQTTGPQIMDVELSRDETLYFAGLQWGPIVGWNPFSPDMNNALALTQAGGGSRVVMFETLYMYNMLDGSLVPLIADGPYEWNADMTEMTVKIKPAAKWSDGTAITAQDVAYTFECSVKYGNTQGVAFKPYIDAIEAVDESTVLIKSAIVDGKPANPLMVLQFLGQVYVLQKAWLQKLEERCSSDGPAMLLDTGLDAVYSGPYTMYFWDNTKVILIRDDNYWGQDASMWGRLPAPKYLAHAMYADNNAGVVALQAGEVDVCQEFISNVQDLWLNDGLPISTYMDEPPYGICVNMPTAWFNLSSPGLDNVAIRKAIAIAVDYPAIIANAMTNQSPTFEQVPRSLMNPTDGEQALYDKEAVKDLQWGGNDVEGAKKLLDDAGIVDTDGDGWREIDGENLRYNACAPAGWSDWEAAMEIVAAAGKAIGIDISTDFPEWEVYQKNVTAAEQDFYDIFMMWTDSATPAMPWARVRMIMSSEYNGVEGNWSGNWGHYSNPRVDELIRLIPIEPDHDKVVDMYTECVKIYLTDVPSFSLMYRPDQFHTINESVWTGFTEAGDGNNIPPMHSTDGYAIADLYNIRLAN